MVITMKDNILQNDEGISPVIGTVLLLAIGMTVLMTVQLNFVPVWNEQEELNHLEKMNDDFKELKSSIESSAVSGTALSVPLTMGFKYSPKIIAYNPRDSAHATLSIQKDVWAEVRYNELTPEGMDDATSIKNVTSTTISYALQSSHNLSYLIYEHGLIRRSTSNYTPSAQALVTNNSLYLLGVNATEPETTSSLERRVINIYPTSPAKNSVIGRNVWLTLHTKYADWWTDPNNPSSIQNLGGTIYKKDTASGTIIAYFDSMELRMGETQVTTRPKKPPERLPAYRLVKITPQNVNLPVVGINSLIVEVQDSYNNPVPNVLVNFSINETRKPGNAYSTATLLQNSVISGADGRATIQLKTSGAGLYYIDAGIPAFNTTFTYPASSQGGFISLTYNEPTVTATLRNASGEPSQSEQISFAAGEGTVTPATATTDVNGNASTTLNTSTATGIKLTNIQTSGVTNISANITWDTVNTITVAANRTPGGYIFGNIDVQTSVNSDGCVRYGTSPGNYPYLSSCDNNTASHSIALTNLQPYTAYYFIVNSSRAGGESINSSEYMFVTESGILDTTPPASITNPNNVSYLPMYINWTWDDPADADFKEVQIYIDGTYKTTVAKGVNYFNGSYFRPNSTHTINTHTVDTSGNVNTTWVNWTANTSSVFTYVFGYDLITGTVTGFGNAQNDSDSGASATFAEEQVGGVNKSNRTMLPSKTIVNGTQSGVYTPGNLDAVDGSIDITNLTLASATLHATANPVMSIGTITLGTYLDSRTSNNGYLELRENTAGQLDSRWNSWEQFTNASNTSLVEMDIGIEAYVADGEAVYVQLWDYPNNNWNTTWHQLGTTGLPTTDTNAVFWYNITNAAEIQRFVNSTGGYRIRFADAKVAVGTADAVRSRFEIDEFKVQFAYFANTLDVTYTFTETNSSASWQSISIQDSSYGDALANASIYNFVGGQWESVLTSAFTGGTTPVTHVNTVVGASGNASNYDSGGGQIKLRYNWTGATANNSLGVDMVNVTVFYSMGGVFRLNATTNTTDIPDASTQTLQLRYNVSNDNFTLQLWNGSAWNNRTTLDNTTMSYRNITLLPEEFIPDGSLTGSAGTVTTGYVLVRYLDLNASAVQQGSLYLDYQRVNST